ncbi:hypothetical protein CGRA01v4_05380 [Colletotrichum graminicola]|nr:hypothetical protein CGRA01v4_05380 [Colletotrichum graminicola]
MPQVEGRGVKKRGGGQELTSFATAGRKLGGGSTQLEIASRVLQTIPESGMMGFGRTTGSSENQTTADYYPMPATLSLASHWPNPPPKGTDTRVQTIQR